ncbi:virion structural protein [Burkholderia phage BcepB1A]|uniref:virion structural protein n=1 Tax=Burkholderia phage BcepB1A TaxID=279530 RepID=UPI0000377992|nr:virion structural protein [Burkholderia phage BcepB1A]AAT37727.1 gp21 [Burkholderia phage BcepB1A]
MDHTLDITKFRALFPEFNNDVKYPDALLEQWYAVAGEYLGLTDYACGLNGNTLDLALMQLTAHLMKSATILSSNKGAPMVMTSATIDKVSISTLAPPIKNGWQYWLSTTPYGQMLWALLSMRSSGGFVYGGSPELSGYRRIGGVFKP